MSNEGMEQIIKNRSTLIFDKFWKEETKELYVTFGKLLKISEEINSEETRELVFELESAVIAKTRNAIEVSYLAAYIDASKSVE